MTTNQLFFIDTETGGLDPLKHSMLSLGVVHWYHGEMVAETEFFVREDVICVTPEALNVNKMDLTELQEKGLPPNLVLNYFERFLQKYRVPDYNVMFAGHNVGFDIGFLKRLYRLENREWPSWFSHRTVDTCSLLETIKLTSSAEGLEDGFSAALQYFGIEQSEEDKHTALSDAYCSALLFNELTGRFIR